MPPKLFAFDLDGTLLTTDKRLSDANREALIEMHQSGAVVALASGRLGSSMKRVADLLGFDPAMLTLNGAAVYPGLSLDDKPIYAANLPAAYADHLTAHAAHRDFALNYYYQGKLYSVRNRLTQPWLDLYVQQTASDYEFIDSWDSYRGEEPHKIIFVGDNKTLDKEEEMFRKRWDSELYIVRTWDYYLEFLNPKANKARGISALADHFGIDLADVATFGDSENDIPMLRTAGHGIAMQNASDKVKAAAGYVSPWTNDQDAIAREWERLRAL